MVGFTTPLQTLLKQDKGDSFHTLGYRIAKEEKNLIKQKTKQKQKLESDFYAWTCILFDAFVV